MINHLIEQLTHIILSINNFEVQIIKNTTSYIIIITRNYIQIVFISILLNELVRQLFISIFTLLTTFLTSSTLFS